MKKESTSLGPRNISRSLNVCSGLQCLQIGLISPKRRINRQRRSEASTRKMERWLCMSLRI
ncbi:hypothetical protein I7I53_11194 [Histoplasma capsulatum var. duboisii H88]|uniref:Uncharacterized protein n=1 Tax=Ajellomyces capsulatus (strain H88) TaxID=544711 RepID=A0A8A1LDG3_AJEC8|nr:hypothetical protein I7I53_11194 [Histoplasma capsulatum var. duboisii H88]